MMPTRRALLAAGLAAPLAAPAIAQGQWPERAVRIIVPWPPGGSTDVLVRIYAERLQAMLGQSFVVENRPGAGGNIGVDAVAKSAPDGHTIGLAAAGALSVNQSLYPKMPFDPQKDLAPISMLAMIPFFLVAHPSQAPTLAEVLEDARKKPFPYGHGGNGSAMHLSGELLKMMANVPLLAVAYKGSGPVATDVLGGQVPLGIVDVPSAIAHVRAGKMRALAVTTKRRISAAPDVPTFEEAGIPGYESIGWFGAVAPAGTPNEVIGRLNREIAAALAAPDVRDKAIAAGCEPAANSLQEFAAFVRDEARKWADVIKKAGVKLE